MNVLPHQPMQTLEDGMLWRVQGSVPRGPIQRVMTIARRADGALVIHNSIAMDDDEMKALDALGKVGFIIVPNGFHRIDAKQFSDRYPDAKVLCPKGSRERVEQAVKVSGTYEDFPKDDIVSFIMLDGVGDREGAMQVKTSKGVTLVLNDAVFNMPHAGGFGGFVLKSITGSSGGPRVTMITKLALVKDKAAFRACLIRLSETPNLRRIIVSHHEVIDSEPAKTLRAAAEAM